MESKAMRNLDCSCVCRLNGSSPQSTVQIFFFLGEERAASNSGRIANESRSIQPRASQKKIRSFLPPELRRLSSSSFSHSSQPAGEIKSKMACYRANKIKMSPQVQISNVDLLLQFSCLNCNQMNCCCEILTIECYFHVKGWGKLDDWLNFVTWIAELLYEYFKVADLTQSFFLNSSLIASEYDLL
jgi:hypothetical protein